RGRREIRRAVAADQQDARLNSRTLVGAEAVDEQPLALSDAVLLAAQTDDRVGAHGVETRALRPRQGSVANGSCRARRPTPASGSGVAGSAASAPPSRPRSSPGTWIVTPRDGSGVSSAAPSSVAASAVCAVAGFLRLRPPREPRRVFFFGVGASSASAVSAPS